MEKAAWYKDWFNSPYYHLLYHRRDIKEANVFIEKLAAFLKLQKRSKVWDLACGKGRHALILNKLGFDVVGTDLSEESILEANKEKNENLEFYIHDMREPFRINYFDVVVNLFTSIGYFEKEADNFKVFHNAYGALKENGFFIVDFFNQHKVRSCMVKDDQQECSGILFKIHKQIQNNRIIKTIEFKTDGKRNVFQENVSLLSKENLLQMADECGFKLFACFGNYNLDEFELEQSDRLILILRK